MLRGDGLPTDSGAPEKKAPGPCKRGPGEVAAFQLWRGRSGRPLPLDKGTAGPLGPPQWTMSTTAWRNASPTGERARSFLHEVELSSRRSFTAWHLWPSREAKIGSLRMRQECRLGYSGRAVGGLPGTWSRAIPWPAAGRIWAQKPATSAARLPPSRAVAACGCRACSRAQTQTWHPVLRSL